MHPQPRGLFSISPGWLYILVYILTPLQTGWRKGNHCLLAFLLGDPRGWTRGITPLPWGLHPAELRAITPSYAKGSGMRVTCDTSRRQGQLNRLGSSCPCAVLDLPCIHLEASVEPAKENRFRLSGVCIRIWTEGLGLGFLMLTTLQPPISVS